MCKSAGQRFSVSGQIVPSKLATLQADGVSVVINNRPDAEEAGQPTSDALAKAAAALGLTYYHIPVTPGQFDRADALRMAQIVDSASGQVHAFCRTGNRSTKLLELGRSLDKG